MTRPIAPHRIAQVLRDGRAVNSSAASTRDATAPLKRTTSPADNRGAAGPVPLWYRVFEWLWLLPTLFLAVYFALQFLRVAF